MTVGVAIAIVLVPEEVDAKVQVEAPLAFDVVQAPRVLPLPETVKVGVTPLIKFEFASVKVIEIVEVDTPSDTTGPVPAMRPFVGLPAVNKTLLPVLLTGVRIDNILDSARDDLSEHVETPLAFVEEHTP